MEGQLPHDRVGCLLKVIQNFNLLEDLKVTAIRGRILPQFVFRRVPDINGADDGLDPLQEEGTGPIGISPTRSMQT